MKPKLQKNIPTHHYLNGEWICGRGSLFYSTNPSDGTLIWEGSLATDDEISIAFSAARHALEKWSLLEFAARVIHIQNFKKEIVKNANKLAHLISEETGKPSWEAVTEVNAVIGKINLSIESYEERTSQKAIPNPDASGFVRYKPHGVIAGLGPFNFPAHLSNGHIVPALLAGNTVIYKPSELTPAVAELVVQCWHDSGLPPGVLNCIQGDASCAKKLLKQDIQGVYFTGSYSTGVNIHQQFSGKPEVILALEMGGNNPLVIDSIKNQEAAVYNTLLSTMITAGQRCSCARRVIIPNNGEGDAFLKRFIKSCQQLSVGKYTLNPEPFMGPVISHSHALSHLRAQHQLIDSGGVSLLEMSLLNENSGFLSPGIVDMSAVKNPADEEIFAPLVQIYRYNDFDQALTLSNQTRYGLAAGIFTDSNARFQQFYHYVRAGLINWNKPTTGAASNLPFGGVGRSGNHRPSAYFAADYCAYPIAILEQHELVMPSQCLPGIKM